MIETIMYFAIGFLVASLFGLVLIPLVHNRAVRLTVKRLEAATPLSMAEIQADKDQLRAEFAMSTRRLEMSVEQMKARTTGQLAELGKKTDAIHRLKAELGEKTAAMFAMEAREKTLREQINMTEGEYALKVNLLRDAERSLVDKQAEMTRVAGSDAAAPSADADMQRIEVVALRTQVEALKQQVAERERDARDVETRLRRERDEAAGANGDLVEARGKVGTLDGRVEDLERALAAQTSETERTGQRAQELESRLAEQMRVLAERELEVTQLRDKLTAAARLEGDLRAEIASSDGRHRSATEGLRLSNADLEARIAAASNEHDRLKQEMAGMTRDAGEAWSSERLENAMLRERINDIAAEIARMTMTLEGEDSPIPAMLATAPVDDADQPATEADMPRGNLADRIRALQTKATRVQAAH